MVPRTVLTRPNAVVNTARPKAILSVVKGNKGNVGNPQQDLKYKGVIESGCSRHMTGNRSYLTDYEEIDGGFVAFGGNSKGGKITGKGKIRTSKLDFKDVYFVKELKFNLFSVSQMCDKKNSVLFTDTECVVLSPDFKLTDESHVLLKVPRKDNMYSVDLKNVVPQGGLTCLFAKATPDESNLWHRRLGHVNFKTMNKLVRGNLVRGIENLIDLRIKVIRCDSGTEFKNRVMNQLCEMKGRKPALSFIRPFGCPVIVLNTIDHQGKFDGKADEGFFVGYSTNSKAFRVFNGRTRIVEENLHVQFSENTSNIAGSGPNWLFDIDALTNSMNYKPVVAGNLFNSNADPPFSSSLKDSPNAGFKPSGEEEKKDAKDPGNESGNPTEGKDSEVPSIEELRINQEKDDNINSTNNINTASDGNSTNNVNAVSSTINVAGIEVNVVDPKTSIELPNYQNMPELEDIVYSDDDEDVGVEANMNNLDAFMPVSHIPTTRIHKDHPVDQIIGDLNSASNKKNDKELERTWFAYIKGSKLDLPNGKRDIGTKWVYKNKKDERGIVIKNKARLVAQWYTQEEWIDYDEFFPLGSLFCQPPGFEDLDFPDKVYKVEKALYGLHQAPKSWYETLSTYLLENGFQRGQINKTLFIKRDQGDILIVQVYVDDIIFGSTKKKLCTEFEKMMHKKFHINSIGELTFFLGLQVKQKEDGIFISQDTYVTEILKKISFSDVKTANTPMETHKPLLKDTDGEDVDEHMYRSMIGSLMYLTSSRPDIMFVVCVCAKFQVNPKVSFLHAVKRIFRYLKGQPKLGLWYPKDSPFDLVAYTDSDYAGASLDKKSTTGVAFLTKSAESEGFEQIVDFLNESSIKYALTVNPTIYTSCIEQYWSTAKAKTVNWEVQLQTLVDGKKIVVTEASVRRDLQLEDANGVDCLPNATIFEQLTLMGAKTTAWNEFSSTMASAIICVANNQKFNFSKYIFESMMKNLDSAVKFLMYPRFVQGKDFSGRVTPLFSTMMVQAQQEQGEDEAVNEENVSKHSNDPLLSGEDGLKLEKLMTLCTNLQNRVLDLEHTKTTQALEIDSLKRRVKKIEKKQRSRTHRLRRLYKVGLSAKVVSSEDEGLGEEDASKQGRKIHDIDADEDITLENVHDADMFGVHDFDGDEVFVETKEPVVNAATTTSTIPVSAAKDLSDVNMTLA
ncbi:putative ribonuclease H-like domain-containing protein [Tanacetum coccineum]